MRATLPFTALLLAGMVCIVAGAEALRGSEPILENDDNYGGCAVSQTSPRCLINCAETMDSLSAITYTCSGAAVGSVWALSVSNSGSNDVDCHVAVTCGSSQLANWDLTDGQSSSTKFIIGGSASCNLEINVENQNFLDSTVCNVKLT